MNKLELADYSDILFKYKDNVCKYKSKMIGLFLLPECF